MRMIFVTSKVIFNADDFGYSKAINLGIIQAHKNGILSSATLMANMPGFEDAVKLAKENPELGVGVHLTLTCGYPVLSDVPTLCQENGKFHKLTYYEKQFDISQEELYKEWDAQIKKVIHAGIDPTHLDSHHHINRLPPMKEVFIELARKYKLPVRNNFDVPKDIKTVNRFFLGFDLLGIDKEIWKPMTINNLIQDCLTFGTVEVMCHPGYLDHIVLENSSMAEQRAFVLKELQVAEYRKLLNENNIEIVTYRDI